MKNALLWIAVGLLAAFSLFSLPFLVLPRHATIAEAGGVELIYQLDLAALGRRLKPTVAEVRNNEFLLRFRVPPYELTVFADGRAIIKGTRDPGVALPAGNVNLYAYVNANGNDPKPGQQAAGTPCSRLL